MRGSEVVVREGDDRRRKGRPNVEEGRGEEIKSDERFRFRSMLVGVMVMGVRRVQFDV